jgi:hypothetical protein
METKIHEAIEVMTETAKGSIPGDAVLYSQAVLNLCNSLIVLKDVVR